MPNPFAGLFGRSASTPEAETDYNAQSTNTAQLEAAAEIGGKIATLEASLKAEQDKSAALTASLETTKASLVASTDALREEAKKAAVVAFGPTTPATTAEVAFLDACSDPAQLSACIARYRAATPAALSGATVGTRETTSTAEADKPKVAADRLVKIEEERKAGQEAAERRRKQEARTGRASGGK